MKVGFEAEDNYYINENDFEIMITIKNNANI